MSFIEIVEDGATFDWSPVRDPSTGARYETVFTLQKMSLTERRRLFHQHTKTVRGVKRTDEAAFADAALDAVLKDWRGVTVRKADGTTDDLSCTPEAKKQLPEAVKGQIIEMCLGGEFSDAFEDPDGDADPTRSGATSTG